MASEDELLLDRNQISDTTAVKKKWTAAIVLATSLAMVCKGLVYATLGLTLTYLGTNTNSSIGALSNMFSVRAIGLGLGAVAFSYVKTNVKGAKPVASSAVALFVLGIVTLSVPFLRSLNLLVGVQCVGGFAQGYAETALTSLYLASWGEVHSRPYIQLKYFMFSIGGFVAPLLAKPFLEMANQQQNPAAICPGYEATAPTVSYLNVSKPDVDYGITNPIMWQYFIIGTYTILVSILFSILGACKVENKVYGHNDEQTGDSESRAEESWKDIWMFLVSVIMFSYFTLPSYLLFQAYIYSTAICSDLKMTTSEAATLNSLFWGAFGISRGLTVITSRYFKPSTILIADILGVTGAMVSMSIWGETTPAVMRIGAAAHGFFVATLLPSGISWASQVTNMSGKYVFLFLLGGNIGNAIMIRIGGAVFQLNPFSTIYFVTGICVAVGVCFVMMNLFAPTSNSQQS